MIHDVVTRWNFAYNMCRCLLDNKQAFAVFCSDELKGVTGRLKQSQPPKDLLLFFKFMPDEQNKNNNKKRLNGCLFFCISADFWVCYFTQDQQRKTAVFLPIRLCVCEFIFFS